MILTNEQEVRHRATLNAARGDPAIEAINAILEHELAKVKDKFVDGSRDDLLHLQGEARAFRRILKALKERPGATPKV